MVFLLTFWLLFLILQLSSFGVRPWQIVGLGLLPSNLGWTNQSGKCERRKFIGTEACSVSRNHTSHTLFSPQTEKCLSTLKCYKEIKPVNPKGNQSWIFIGRTDAEAEVPILWLSDAKSWLTGKVPEAGNDWRQEEKGMTEDVLVGWHHQLDGHEF